MDHDESHERRQVRHQVTRTAALCNCLSRNLGAKVLSSISRSCVGAMIFNGTAEAGSSDLDVVGIRS